MTRDAAEVVAKNGIARCNKALTEIRKNGCEHHARHISFGHGIMWDRYRTPKRWKRIPIWCGRCGERWWVSLRTLAVEGIGVSRR